MYLRDLEMCCKYIKMFLMQLLICFSSEVFAARRVDLTQTVFTLPFTTLGYDGPSLSQGLHLPKDIQLEERDALLTSQGTTVKKFRETYRGMPVYNTIVDIEEIPNGATSILGGDVYFDLEEDLVDQLGCKLEDDERVQIALDHARLSSADVSTRQTFPDLIIIDDNSKAVLATRISLTVFTINGDLHRPVTIIAKCDKTVISQWDRSVLRTIDEELVAVARANRDQCRGSTTPRTGPPPTVDPSANCDVTGKAGNPDRPFQIGGSSNHCLKLRREGDDCYLENSMVKGVNLNNRQNDRSTRIVKFVCSEGYDDAVNGGFGPMFEAFYFGTRSVEMYPEWYNYVPTKQSIYVKVHYGRNYQNAYFDGTAMVFGDGQRGSSYPWTNLDTVAHEYGHAVIDASSELEYRRQSGGMNEAFADMVGEVAEAFIFGQSDMISGLDLLVAPNKGLRYFDDPTKDGRSIKHVDDYNSRMNVHYSSGVYNHVFWLLQQNMGIRAAFECFLNANRLYWTARSDFESGACGTLQGAYDAGLDMDVVASSFQVVGVTRRNCKPIEEYVTAVLTPGNTQNNLRISTVYNPLFKVDVSSRPTKISVTVTDGYHIAISKSYQRSEASFASGQSEVEAFVPNDVNTIYIRVFAQNGTPEIKNGNILINSMV